jgi:hypothetical protein
MKPLSKVLLNSPHAEKIKNQLRGDTDWAKLFTGHHLEPGIVSYDNPDGTKTVYLLTREAIAKMRPTAEGKPIVGLSGGYDHKQVKPSDFKEGQVDGVVIESFDNPEAGWEDVRFIVWDDDTKAKCRQGFQLSCAYVPTETREEKGLWHNCPYDAVILNGEYTHVAVVPNPRYEGAEIYNSLHGGLVDKVLKAMMSVIPVAKLREVVNSLEADEKANAPEFKVGDKVKYHGKPGTIVEVGERDGKPWYSFESATGAGQRIDDTGGFEMANEASPEEHAKHERSETPGVEKAEHAVPTAPAANAEPAKEPVKEPVPAPAANAEPVAPATNAEPTAVPDAKTIPEPKPAPVEAPAAKPVPDAPAANAEPAKEPAAPAGDAAPVEQVEKEARAAKETVETGGDGTGAPKLPLGGGDVVPEPSLIAAGTGGEPAKNSETSKAEPEKTNSKYKYVAHDPSMGEDEVVASSEAEAWQKLWRGDTVSGEGVSAKEAGIPIEKLKASGKLELSNAEPEKPEPVKENTAVDVVEFFRLAFGKKPEDDPSYFDDWKRRFSHGNETKFMDSRALAVYKQLGGEVKNASFKFKDQNGEIVTVEAADEKSAWDQLSKDFATPMDAMKKMGIELVNAESKCKKCGHDVLSHYDEGRLTYCAESGPKKGPNGGTATCGCEGDDKFNTVNKNANMEICPQCCGSMQEIGNVLGTRHLQCSACGAMDTKCEETKNSGGCTECGHSSEGHDEFGCKEPGCSCSPEVSNSFARDLSSTGRRLWDVTPRESRATLLNSMVRRDVGDVPHSFWTDRNFDELPENFKKALSRRGGK